MKRQVDLFGGTEFTAPDVLS